MNNPEKLAMRTPSLADDNFTKLAALFPNAVTETIDENGAVVRAIDKDVLAQEINAHVVEGREERYQFTWPDKRKSILLANAPVAAALRPCREESTDFDTTENLYIEGDNLDVLKLLRETYLNKVKMIYIEIITSSLIQSDVSFCPEPKRVQTREKGCIIALKGCNVKRYEKAVA
jgi:adenine-specific DNA-methyltransferase